MEKDLPPGVKAEPSLLKLAADKTPTTPGKRGVGRPAAPKDKAPAKPLSYEATKYAMDNIPGLGGGGGKNDEQNRSKYWSMIAAYKRRKDRQVGRFKNLDFSKQPSLDAPAAVVKAFVDDLSNQLSEESAVRTIKYVYCKLLEVLVRGNYAMGNPWGLNITSLPAAARKAVEEKDFLHDEFEEIAILHPEWCRPGPELRVVMATVDLIREINQMETSGAAYVDPTAPVSKNIANKYGDL